MKRLAILLLFVMVGYSAPSNFYGYFEDMALHQTKFVSCKLVEKNCQKTILGISKGSVQYRCKNNIHVRRYGNRCTAHIDYSDPRTAAGAINHLWYDFFKFSKP